MLKLALIRAYYLGVKTGLSIQKKIITKQIFYSKFIQFLFFS